MLKAASLRIVLFLIVIGLGLSACQPQAATPKVNSSTQVAISAGQTLTAMPTTTPFPPATDTQIPEPTSTVTSTPVPTLGPIAVGPDNFPADVDPLTGMTVSDAKILDRSPVMIKVSNYPATGRPHAGLSSADIVFDYYIGEGANRFLALFYGQDSDKVGPIRSGRYVDAQLVPMYNGLLGFAFADARVYAKITTVLGNRAVVPSVANCPAICDDGHNTVISVFSNTAEFTKLEASKGVGNTKPNLNGMVFNTTPPQGGKPAQDINVNYSVYNREEWRYDTASGKYLRWTDPGDTNQNSPMVELTDRNTGKQLAFSNVIVVFAMYIEYAPTLHDIMVATNAGGQKAIMFRDGQAYEGIWKSAGANKPMQFFTKDGKAFALKPGNTWMNLFGQNSTTKTDADKWQIQFSLP